MLIYMRYPKYVSSYWEERVVEFPYEMLTLEGIIWWCLIYEIYPDLTRGYGIETVYIERSKVLVGPRGLMGVWAVVMWGCEAAG